MTPLYILATLLGAFCAFSLCCASRNGNRASQRYQSCNTGKMTISELQQHGVKDVRNN